MHVGLGPGVGADQVEFIAGPGTAGAWLFAQGDVLVAKVNGTGATLILTSVRDSQGEVLSIEVERLESRSKRNRRDGQPVRPAAPVSGSSRTGMRAPAAAAQSDGFTVPLQIKTHIRSRGDMSFSDAPWAGRVGPGLWIESFSIRPLEHLEPQGHRIQGPDRHGVRDAVAQRRAVLRHQGHVDAAGRICGAAEARAPRRRRSTASTPAITAPALPRARSATALRAARRSRMIRSKACRSASPSARKQRVRRARPSDRAGRQDADLWPLSR